MNQIKFTIALLLLAVYVQAQQPITYYLPNIEYNKEIPTPEEVLGYQVGEWHVSHDQLVMYMRELARVSDRITLETFARTYENRPLLLLTVTSPDNHKNIDNIRQQHVQLTDADNSASLNTSEMPIVLYQGYSIHGNEASGSNAALLYAYYLAAAQGTEIEKMLNEVVVLLDPSFNPDGLHRFSTWVNMHKNKNLTANNADREYREAWPGGRTNHYWFDLNRDWLPTQHPESQGRIRNFHNWKPNILTDHHEMGTNSTFFFQPGIPSRTHPWTPNKNQELTAKIATYHAAGLNEIKSLYYSQENYDDFYYGKGSTYPDVNGAVGILFEQASSRGHIQQSINGVLTFPFTVKNQFTTSLTTLKAGYEMREEMLNYQREFYKIAKEVAAKDKVKAIVFGDEYDAARNTAFLKLLKRHQIQIHALKDDITIKGQSYKKESAYVIPLQQQQYKLIKAIFEKRTTFQDSLFYDVSAFNLAMSFNIPFAEVAKKNVFSNVVGDAIEKVKEPVGKVIGNGEYAYVFSWDSYYAPRATYELMNAGVTVRVASEPFNIPTSEGLKNFERGTIMVATGNMQGVDKEGIRKLLQKVATRDNLMVYAVSTGSTPEGIDLGSRNFYPLNQPKVMLVVGSGASSYDAGEAWHLLDQRFDIPVTKVEASRISSANLDNFNVILMENGSFGTISNRGTENIKQWVQKGGTLVTSRGAVRWAMNKKLAHVKFSFADYSKDKGRRPYAKASADGGSKVVGGAIFETSLDLTHPLTYGYHRKELPVFRRGTTYFDIPKNPYAAPLVYNSQPLLSGYINTENKKALSNTASVVVSGVGRGRTISFADNVNFRAFWYGTNKLYLNAIFFGQTISRSTVATSEE